MTGTNNSKTRDDGLINRQSVHINVFVYRYGATSYEHFMLEEPRIVKTKRRRRRGGQRPTVDDDFCRGVGGGDRYASIEDNSRVMYCLRRGLRMKQVHRVADTVFFNDRGVLSVQSHSVGLTRHRHTIATPRHYSSHISRHGCPIY